MESIGPLASTRRLPLRRVARLATCALLAAGSTGCAVFSISPAFELVKASAAVAVTTIATGPSKAKNSIYHEHGDVKSVCIAYNPRTPDPDIPPALQMELKFHEVESRVYDADAVPASCEFVLSYAADIEWDVPPLGGGYKSYIRSANLSLRDNGGKVLASSAYELDGSFQMGKWATSRSKLAPMVTQVVTGFDH